VSPLATPTRRAATEVDFVKLSPTQNMTVLVTSQHPVPEYRSIAAQLLSAGHVHAEQVGFVRRASSSGAQVRLHMAGDEFCGNACMALAALTAAQHGIDDGAWTEVVLESSGVDAALTSRVGRRGTDYDCHLTLPDAGTVEPYVFPGVEPGRSALVRHHDAVHVVVECDPQDGTVRERARDVAAHLGATEDASVVVVMLYDPERAAVAPLVTVPTVGSTIWERSCASGTAALGAYLAARRRGPVRASILQPGGTMHVRADLGPGGQLRLTVGGQVRIVAEGRAFVHG
jgi:diaminopimelate epimerase